MLIDGGDLRRPLASQCASRSRLSVMLGGNDVWVLDHVEVVISCCHPNKGIVCGAQEEQARTCRRRR